MKQTSYTALQRQAANQVWNAAGCYDFEPLFLADHAKDSISDFYMNLLIGLAYKYYGEQTICDLFNYWRGDVRESMLDDLTWLYLEQVLYTLERPTRPSMPELRTSYAKEFFAGEYQLSRQEWMSKNTLVYHMQSARWSAVLNSKKTPLLPREQKLYQALAPTKIPSKDKLTGTLLGIYQQFHLFDGKKHEKKMFRFHFTGTAAKVLSRIMPVSRSKNTQVTVMRSEQAETLTDKTSGEKKQGSAMQNKESHDCAYIENCFGRLIFPEREMKKAERELCTGNHRGCHLWFTDGKINSANEIPSEFRHLQEQARLQAERNRSYYHKNIQLHLSLISRLTDQIRNSILIHQQPDVLPGRDGNLDTTRVWRAKYLRDDRIFHTKEEDDHPAFTVDLLLDASASRLQYQEILAAQGVILAKSLLACHIPVRVSRFCSVRGYTVFHILKNFTEKKCDRIFHYYATGWNRDGLALREAAELLQLLPSPADKHLLLILTDAAPNDSQRILPSENAPFGSAYEEHAAIKDTAAEVRALRKNGIHVSAVFMGNDGEVTNAKQIYGKEFTRIRQIDQLSKAAGRLIQKEIRELYS